LFIECVNLIVSVSGFQEPNKLQMKIYSPWTGFGIIVLFNGLISCSEEVIPVLTTHEINYITSTSATSGGTINDEGSSAITDRGICLSTSAAPTIDDNKVSSGAGIGSFICSIDGLNPVTTYYVRAFATNRAGTAYGEVLSFLTNKIVIGCTPDLNSPAEGAMLDNGCFDQTDEINWHFDWSSCPNATQYSLYVKGEKALNPVIDVITAETEYESSGIGYIMDSYYLNWSWKVMAYVNGEWGEWSEERGFVVEPVPTQWVMDVDGNHYNTVTIGNQVWLQENLRVTLFNNWTPVHLVSDNTEWSSLITSGYCWYNNEELTNRQPYGALYNWDAVNSGNLCPVGWHVPSASEWEILIGYLGGNAIAGGRLKESGTEHWSAPNTGATDESGFTAVPGGVRQSTGIFSDIGLAGNFWTSTRSIDSDPQIVILNSNSGEANNIGFCNPTAGISVRCVRDK
jgi:uncharacterized protein (TIGR02145 family)